MNDVTPKLLDLHRTYIETTGLRVAFDTGRMLAWEHFASKGWGTVQLSLVVRMLKTKIRNGQKWGSCLSFRRLIEDVAGFEELLAEASAMARAPKPHPAAAELRATGRSAEPPDKRPKSAEEILKSQELWKKFRQNLGL